MQPNTDHPRHVPWVAIVLGVLALVSVLFSLDVGSAGYAGDWFSVLIPIIIFAPIVAFFWGLARFITNTEQQQKNSGVHIMLWSLAALALLAAAWFALRITQTSYRVTSTDPIIPKGIVINQESSGAYGNGSARPSAQSSLIASPDYYPRGYPNEVSITDTREFLKTDYNATMRTRQVQVLTRRAETTIRGFDGRVDQTQSSEKYGYVSFVVPASKFEEFRTEIESFVQPKFLSVDISTQNLLPQKLTIEERQEQVEKSLTDLKTERAQRVASHAGTVKSLQGQIDANQSEQGALRIEITNDPVRQAQINARLSILYSEAQTLRSRLSNENASYASALSSLDAQIKFTNSNLEAVKTQDQDLLDTVATVRGTIAFNWISYWEIARLYLPGFWIPAILGVLALLAYFWERRRSL